MFRPAAHLAAAQLAAARLAAALLAEARLAAALLAEALERRRRRRRRRQSGSTTAATRAAARMKQRRSGLAHERRRMPLALHATLHASLPRSGGHGKKRRHTSWPAPASCPAAGVARPNSRIPTGRS
jgi:hypothetical protein